MKESKEMSKEQWVFFNQAALFAMSGMFARQPSFVRDGAITQIAETAYQAASAMLEEQEKWTITESDFPVLFM